MSEPAMQRVVWAVLRTLVRVENRVRRLLGIARRPAHGMWECATCGTHYVRLTPVCVWCYDDPDPTPTPGAAAARRSEET